MNPIVKRPEQHPHVEVRDSPVHGSGVFATGPIRAGEPIGVYAGRMKRHEDLPEVDPDDPAADSRTYIFILNDEWVVDGADGGDFSALINHSCEPNVEAVIDNDAPDGEDPAHDFVSFYALRDIEPGEELFFDYELTIDEHVSRAWRRFYACRCGATRCRGTMLNVRRRRI